MLSLLFVLYFFYAIWFFSVILRFELLRAWAMKIAIFWNVTQCSLIYIYLS
jgi:hypothetical protein